jgi:predicted patatin/cPLA2 family phospholipase
VEDAFTKQVPLNWAGFEALQIPTFVTATKQDGMPCILRLDGTSTPNAKEHAKSTARIPFIGGHINHHNVWDGALSSGLPIQEAFDLGATHVLVLRCNYPTTY